MFADDALASRTDLTPEDLARVKTVTQPTTDFSKAEDYETMQGGAGTSRKHVNADAFSQPSANMTFEQQATFKLGNALFRKNWVSSPSSTQASDGLGPLFNERACQNCHLKDGRGRPPLGADRTTSMFLRLARAASNAEEQAAVAAHKALNFPDPVYGTQLQELAVPGLAGEGRMAVTYTEEPVTLSDGATVSLRRPAYAVTDLAYGPLDPATTLSPRLTPPMIGLGLVEQIHPADIRIHADPDDRDGDGISGRAAIVPDEATGRPALGRFGWKAQAASIRQQSADALATDIGISSPEAPRHWGDCTEAEPACLAMASGVQQRLGDTEAPVPVMDLITFYAQNLAVPARRNVGGKDVLAGKQAFYEMGCIDCHTPKFVTRRDASDKAQAFQLIWPYSDFLLHDMGEGLADGQPVGEATGGEWRTPPLWGIGLTGRIGGGHAFFLHDGRARTLAEAILWHGGEGTKARDRFAAADAATRAALIKFLESLVMMADTVENPGFFRARGRLFAALTVFLSFAAAQPAPAAPVKTADVIGRAVDGFVRPAYAALHDKASTEAKAVKALCASPSQANLDTARADFSALVDAWSTIEVVQFGPIREDNRLERMLFWPDRKSIGLKQVQAALAAKDPTAADPAAIAGKSVAMQGLGALEYILHGTGADGLANADGTYRCAYGAAVAGNIETIAADVEAAWNKPDGFAAIWRNPGPDNPVYRDGPEAVTDLLGVLIDGLELVRDVRVKGFLGASPEADKPKQAIFWRSGKTADSLAANLDGMDRLFTVSRIGEALSDDARWMAESTHIQMINGVADARAASGPIDAALADPEKRAKLEHFRLVTSSLSGLVGTRMTAEFGLTAGFSSLDGD